MKSERANERERNTRPYIYVCVWDDSFIYVIIWIGEKPNTPGIIHPNSIEMIFQSIVLFYLNSKNFNYYQTFYFVMHTNGWHCFNIMFALDHKYGWIANWNKTSHLKQYGPYTMPYYCVKYFWQILTVYLIVRPISGKIMTKYRQSYR